MMEADEKPKVFHAWATEARDRWGTNVPANKKFIPDSTQLMVGALQLIRETLTEIRGALLNIQYAVCVKPELAKHRHDPLRGMLWSQRDTKGCALADLALSAREKNALCAVGVDTLGKLLSMTAEQVLQIRGLGAISLLDIREKLAEHDLCLAGDDAEALAEIPRGPCASA